MTISIHFDINIFSIQPIYKFILFYRLKNVACNNNNNRLWTALSHQHWMVSTLNLYGSCHHSPYTFQTKCNFPIYSSNLHKTVINWRYRMFEFEGIVRYVFGVDYTKAATRNMGQNATEYFVCVCVCICERDCRFNLFGIIKYLAKE